MENPMLDAQLLTKSYGATHVVAGLSLQLRAGEIVGLLGPNGAGKSTTVAMLCGLVRPDSGEVRIGPGGTDATAATNVMGAGNPALKRRIGLVPQDLALHEDLSAEANLRLFGALYGLGGDRLRRQVGAALDLVGLAERARDKPATFSGGMKRRLNIACALVHDPDILLFDEPTVGVDPQSRNAIFDNLETLRSRGKALLYTTHYMEEAERLCDRLVVMDHGRVVAADTLAGLYRRLPVVQTLTLTVAGDVDLVALARDTGAADCRQQGPTLQVGLGGDSGLAAPAAQLLGWLAGHGHEVSQLASNRANLEDVFLALTGRQLRD
jgi:ABC-2 type transport system ATP-binding protein